MAVNITNLTSINSVYDWGYYASSASGGLFWGVILMALFIIIITRLRKQGTENAIAAASFACFLLSLVFFNLSFVQIAYPVFFALALAGTLFYMKFKPQ